MQKRTFNIVSRSVASLAMGMAITAGSASLASASGHHDKWGNCASGKLSAFDYGQWGMGGYVTAVTSTSLTVQLWDGTTATYTLTPSTTYTEGGTTASITAVLVGDRVQIQTASGSSTTASSVNVELAELFGKVTAVSGNDITIADPQGFSRTIVVSSATTYTNNGASGSLSDVTVGSKVFAAGTIDTNGTSLDALKVSVGMLAHNEFIRGTVSAVSSSSITVASHHGNSSTYALTTATTYSEGSATLAESALAVGQKVTIEVSSATPTTASSVSVEPSTLWGTVTAVSGNVITIKDSQGFSRTVDVSATTKYRDDHAVGALADVTVGSMIAASGVIDANGTTLNAQCIKVLPDNGGSSPALKVRAHVELGGLGVGAHVALGSDHAHVSNGGGENNHSDGARHGRGHHHGFGGGFGR